MSGRQWVARPIHWLSTLLAISVLSCQGLAMNRFEQSAVTIKPFAETATYGYVLKPIDGGGQEVDWNPNTVGTTGIEIFLNGLIGFGIAGRGVMSNTDQVDKGNTNYEDWRFSLAYPSFLIQVDYQQFQGFYVNNTATVDPTIAGATPKIQAPNMSLQNFAVDFTWIMKPESYSIEAALDQTVRQEESGGSWLLSAHASETDLTNDSSIVPAQVRSQYGIDQNVNSAHFHSVLFGGGYGYTIVLWKKLFATIQGTLGLGPQWTDYSDGVRSKQFGQGMSEANGLIAVGYNGDTYFTSAHLIANSTNFRTESLSVTSNLFAFRLAVGARF